MPENSWSENESYDELDPIGSWLSDWYDPKEEEEEFRSDFFGGLGGRRRKAAVLLMMVWGSTIALHLISWGSWIVAGLTGLLAVQVARIVLTRPQTESEPLSDDALAHAPSVSILVAAQNEEAVIGKLVDTLCNLDYPNEKYELWVIDDHSTDQTSALLDKLAKDYEQLKVLHRPKNASGGKSGALNQALSLTRGEIIAVFDADAQVPNNILRRVLPRFDAKPTGAVQARKAIANAPFNFWTRGQMAEMALDSFIQQQRIATGGIGELRGNGQFVRRAALESCGGWNEQTITDDLDLTLRLHLDRWDIEFLPVPAVEEEGVTRASSLWHQRNRWVEGGYQRYLDYWRLIARNRMGFSKTLDLFSFVLIQYILPTVAVPDFLIATVRHRLPMLMPLTSLLFALSIWAMSTGLRRTHRKREESSLPSIILVCIHTLQGMTYMFHWLVIVPITTARMAVRAKQLKWVKTSHQGSS
ncbi:MAG: glycosyl transferase [Cyanobacteria bacterium QS_6_48_18]|jgi:1,2-diacylglycerol 3-beta-glucosyltransferase|nr:MAG: glycosyl transferase [Cyanobacteria bacterium QS_6_48_18]